MASWQVKISLVLAILALVLTGAVFQLAIQGKDAPAVLSGALTACVLGITGLLAHRINSAGGDDGGVPPPTSPKA